MTKQELENKLDEELRPLYQKLDLLEMEYENAVGEIEDEISVTKDMWLNQYGSQFKVGDIVVSGGGKRYEVVGKYENNNDKRHFKVKEAWKGAVGYTFWMEVRNFEKESEV